MIPQNKQQRVRFEANQRLDYEDLRDIMGFSNSNLLAALRAIMVPGGVNGIARISPVVLGTGLTVKVTPPVAGVTSTGIIAMEAADGVQTLSLAARPSTNSRIDLVEVGYAWETDASQARWHRDPANDAKTAPTQVIRERGKVDLRVLTGTPASSPAPPAVTSGYLALAEVTVPSGAGPLVVRQRRESRIEPVVSHIWTGTPDILPFFNGVDIDSVANGGYIDVTTPVGATTVIFGSASVRYPDIVDGKWAYSQTLFLENTDGVQYGEAIMPSSQGIQGEDSDLVTGFVLGVVQPLTDQINKRYRLRLHYIDGRSNAGVWVNPFGATWASRIKSSAAHDHYLVAFTF